jgi:predicted nucleic acid-binding Zn ribbon protein
MSERPTSEAADVYLRIKALFQGTASRPAKRAKTQRGEQGESQPYGSGRDPRGLGSVLDALTSQLGWNSPLAKTELMASWAELVGDDTAAHSTPIAAEDGVLTVRCDSTSWATQLRLMRAELITHIIERYPDAGIESIRFQGPDVPSWKRGPRSIPGRGPRDTYG